MKNIFKILVFFVLLVGCDKVEDYSEIPYIKFQNFRFDVEMKDDYINQIGYLTFDFIDGDGDLGFIENLDSSIHKEIHDIFVYEYTKINNNFVITDTTNYILPFDHFPERVYKKHAKGEMELKLYFINRVSDTIKFEFQIMDRKFHYSNLETTSEFVVPEWN